MQRLSSSRALGKGIFRQQVAARTATMQQGVRAWSSKATGKDDADMSWLTENKTELKKLMGTSMIHEVTMRQTESINKVVPWFIDTMPNSYFRQVRADDRTKHIKAISAMKDIGQEDMEIKMMHESKGCTDMTIIANGHQDQAKLQKQIAELTGPEDSVLSRMSMYSSSDDTLSLNIFSYNSITMEEAKGTASDGTVITEYIEGVKAGKNTLDAATLGLSSDIDHALLEPGAMNEYFSKCAPVYLHQSNPLHFIIQRHLYEKVRGTHGTVVNTVPFSGEIPTKLEGRQAIWMSIASGNVNPDVLLKVAARTCTQHGLDVYRAHIDVVDDNTVQGVPADRALTKDAPLDSVTQLRLLLSPAEGITTLTEAEIETLTRDIRRAKWLGDEVADLSNFDTAGSGVIMGTDRAEVIVALATMLHGPLVKTTAGEGFGSPASIVDLLKGQPNIWMGMASQIADLFLHKFNPKDPLNQQDFDTRHDAIHQKIERLNAANAKKVLGEMLKATKMTLRTNFYNSERYALSLRVDPRIVASGSIGVDPKTPLPFGVFFMKGRNFSGFHCRFRDIARGGLRIVTPGSSDQMNIESTRHFDEVYNLSLAQQLKNKDIPEGGSKAVVLVDTPAVSKNNTFAAARTSVKAFTDSLLDLIVEDSVSKCVDHLNKDELIYLGPDEQVIPEDIEWICNRAGQRGYPIPAAFMSSKARNGINHKVYGVTSEGVVVHLKTALEEHLKIDPKKEQFTVKVTGGPDGDVAGNFFKIMNRDFPDTCKILGIADGFGVAEDPEGLNMGELMRLFGEALPISHFDKSKLSKDGIMMTTDNEEGVERRNTMHFRIKSDAFVPGGGRPNTINIDNWHNFLDKDGVPSSPLIVEGANIFTTVEARQKLFEEGGVAIVKDSSANKCGVITSSDEIACSMLVSEDEFMAVKEELVEDVLIRIRMLAEFEAKLLFREYNNYPGSLPHFSERISNAINAATDACADALADQQHGDELFDKVFPVIRDNLPKKLDEMAWGRVKDRFPLQYQRNAIASTLASRLVYKEGIHFIEAQHPHDLAKLAFAHYGQEQEVAALAKRVEAGDAEAVAHALKLLRKGGTRTALNIF